MNKKQAYHALRMYGVENIDKGHLQRQDEDTFVYTDWGDSIQYTVFGAGGEISISIMSFKKVNDRMDSEEERLYKEMDALENLEMLGYCPDCLQPEDMCVCPDV